MRRRFTSTTLAFVLLVGVASFALADEVQDAYGQGVAAFKSGNFEQAIKDFQVVVQAQPDWPGGHLMLGQSLMKVNRFQEALNHLRTAYDKQPSDVQTQLLLAQAYLGVGRYDDAATLLGGINVRSLPQTHRGVYYQMLAKALQETGRSDQALDALEEAAAADPNDADAQFQYGAAALGAGDIDAALAALAKASQLDAKDPAKLKAYAQALILKGRQTEGTAKLELYQRAARAASSLVALDSSSDNLLLLGEANLGAKQYPAAVAAFEKAAAKNSADFLPDFYIGQAHTATESYTAAETALKRALEKARSQSDKVRVWKQLGFVYEKRKDYAQAKAAYRSAGDQAGVTRVEENERIAQYNREVEAEADELEELRRQQEELEKALEELPGGPPPLR